MAGKVQKLNFEAKKSMDSQVRALKDLQMMVGGGKNYF